MQDLFSSFWFRSIEFIRILIQYFFFFFSFFGGEQILRRLKFLDFSHSCNLRRTPDFSEIINLEVLVLNNCNSLVEVDKSVICLDKLVTFDLTYCKNLELPQEIDEFMKRVNDRETGLEPKSPSIIMQAFHILPEEVISPFLLSEKTGFSDLNSLLMN